MGRRALLWGDSKRPRLPEVGSLCTCPVQVFTDSTDPMTQQIQSRVWFFLRLRLGAGGALLRYVEGAGVRDAPEALGAAPSGASPWVVFGVLSAQAASAWRISSLSWPETGRAWEILRRAGRRVEAAAVSVALAASTAPAPLG